MKLTHADVVECSRASALRSETRCDPTNPVVCVHPETGERTLVFGSYGTVRWFSKQDSQRLFDLLSLISPRRKTRFAGSGSRVMLLCGTTELRCIVRPRITATNAAQLVARPSKARCSSVSTVGTALLASSSAGEMRNKPVGRG